MKTKPKKILLAERFDRIKRYLGDSGLPETNRELATRLNLTEQTLWNYCSGRSKPRARTERAISRLETELGIES